MADEDDVIGFGSSRYIDCELEKQRGFASVNREIERTMNEGGREIG